MQLESNLTKRREKSGYKTAKWGGLVLVKLVVRHEEQKTTQELRSTDVVRLISLESETLDAALLIGTGQTVLAYPVSKSAKIPSTVFTQSINPMFDSCVHWGKWLGR